MKRSRKKRNNRDLDCMPIACPHCGEILFTVYEGTQNAKIGIPCPECGECTVFDIKLVESRERSNNNEYFNNKFPLIDTKFFNLGGNK